MVLLFLNFSVVFFCSEEVTKAPFPEEGNRPSSP